MKVETNLEKIQQNIIQACKRVKRNPNEINIIAVTKYVTIERTEEVVQAGIKNIGENRTEGLLNKQEKITEEVDWHFIGTLQSRKVKDIINEVTMIHSLDRLSVAKQINNRAAQQVDCFIQVNVSGEESKHGLDPEDLLSFIEELKEYEQINVVGLMTMAPYSDDESVIRNVFKALARLKRQVQEKEWKHAPCHYLSMGMSNDYEIAIEEGATHIRLGSTLVGSE